MVELFLGKIYEFKQVDKKLCTENIFKNTRLITRIYFSIINLCFFI